MPSKPIVALLKKLARLASGRGATAGERAAANAAIKRLCEQHQLSQAEIGEASERELCAAPIVRRGLSPWQGAIAGVVCTLTCTSCLRFRGPAGVSVAFLGEKADVEIAAALWRALVQAARQAARRDCGPGWSEYHKSHVFGFVEALQQRTEPPPEPRAGYVRPRDFWREAMGLVPRADRALVVMDAKRHWLATELEKRFSYTERRDLAPRVVEISSGEAFAAGFRAGVKTDIGHKRHLQEAPENQPAELVGEHA